MTKAPILIHPDFQKTFILYTDASYVGFGFILAQERDGKEYPIAYGSRRTLPAERNYSVTDLEGAALIWAVEKNKQYFNTTTPITIVTDHKALATWFTQDLPENRRRARWILKMNQYSFTIRHRQGRSLAHVDYLSRNPISRVSFNEEPNIWEEILPEVHRFIQQDLDTELWRPTITKVEGGAAARRKHRTLTNQIWYNNDPYLPTTWETSRCVDENTYKTEGGLAIEKWWDEPTAVKKYNTEDMYGEVLNITTEPTKTKFSITCLYNEDGIFLSQRKNPEKTMYLLYQVPGGKCEVGETARQGAVRETFEETGIDLKPRRLKFVAHDAKFDCNVYAHRIENVTPEQKEPEEMSPWCQYPWQSFKILKERNKLTPSLITFYREIMEKIGASH